MANNFICPIHGSIPFDETEKKLINSPVFQRLRNIKQLGLTSLVFPNAVHTRFAHSIGVMHLASKIFEAIFQRDIEKNKAGIEYMHKVVRIAGLLHDVGHGPLSHFFEHVIHANGEVRVEELEEKIKLPADFFLNPKEHMDYLKSKLEHEHLSLGIIYHLLRDNPDLAQDVCSLIYEKIKMSPTMQINLNEYGEKDVKKQNQLKIILKSIISSEIDADRLDYLQRDSYFTGAKIASIDINHLLSSISLAEGSEGYYIQLKRNAVLTLEQILISRKQMFNQIYYHRVNIVFEGMFHRIIKSVNNFNFWKRKTLQEFITLSDEKFINTLLDRFGVYLPVDYKDEARTLSQLFFHRTPLELVIEKEIDNDKLDENLHELRQIYKNEIIEDSSLKEFSKADRDGLGKIQGLIRVESSYPECVPLSFNLVSEVMKSNLWRRKTHKILILKTASETAKQIELEKRHEDFIRGAQSATGEAKDEVG